MIRRIIIRNYKGIKDADITFNRDKNILVGNNGAGKSTVIEAMSLALGYGLSSIELTPYTFHKSTWEDYKQHKQLPEIFIEVFFHEEASLSSFSGKNNLTQDEHIGIRLHIKFNEIYREIYESDHAEDNTIIPCEYYTIDRRWFSDEVVKQYKIPYYIHIIDASSSTHNLVRQSKFINSLIKYKLSDPENIQMKSCLRKMKQSFENNEDIYSINKSLQDKTSIIKYNLSIGIDLTSDNAWNTIICPTVDDIPLVQAGLGEQCIIKTLLAIDTQKHDDCQKKSIIIIEEPESHLSHTKMYEMMNLLSTNNSHEQIFITTHNSFVANKLDLTRLILLHNTNGSLTNKGLQLPPEDLDFYKYFFKACDYPTLRLILCKKAIVVEGPTDEMIITYFYKCEYGRHPFDDGIELISVGSLAFKHYLKLAQWLDIKVAVITDNDGKSPADVEARYLDNTIKDNIKVFTENDSTLKTLEPSFLKANDDNMNKVAQVITKRKKEHIAESELLAFMSNNKTEWAFRVLQSIQDKDKETIDLEVSENKLIRLNIPKYIKDAINWIRKDE